MWPVVAKVVSIVGPAIHRVGPRGVGNGVSEFKSEIRDGEIAALEEKVAKDNYGKYLSRLILKRVRGFTDREVSFDFPVTALVGPNGGGKTTILGAAGLIYKDVPPRRFFAKSGKYDSSMKDWTVEYQLIDRSINPKLRVPRTASYLKLKWNRTAVEREVLIFGVERTVPATERRELVKAVGAAFAAYSEKTLSPVVAENVARILGKPVEGFHQVFLDQAERVSLYAGQTSKGDEYSEFHFGAGEASVIRIVSGVEGAAENSLILIEEIENGLHPVATIRMVEYLINVAKRKSCQVIFTTHSNDALAPLPSKAIWASYNGEVLQGKLDIVALRTITGQIDASLAIFVEDVYAEHFLATVLRYSRVELSAVKIHRMGGADPARKVNEQHNLDPTSTFPSICVLDGDQGDTQDIDKRIFVLPGDSHPERHVLDRVVSVLDKVAALLTVSMQLPPSQQERVKEVITARVLSNYDVHVIFEQIGADLDFTAGQTVATAFLSVWAQEFPDEVAELIAPFKELLPMVP
ncbi:MAG: AAA family ATPase [Mycobacterium sp.]|nr:AAA family ATPase [Mycobacterium sp.]